jgi:hypothetical protein
VILTSTGYRGMVSAVKLGYSFQQPKSSRVETFLAHACTLVFASMLTLGLGFSTDELHIYCIQSTKTMLF